MSELIPSGRPVAVPGPATFHPGPGGFNDLEPAALDDTIDLREVLAVLRRHLRLVLLITAAVLGVTGYLAYRERPQYRAAVMLRLKDAQKSITGGLGAATGDDLLGKGTDPILSQIEVLRSRTVADSVVARTALRLETRTRGFAVGSLDGVSVEPDAHPDTLELHFAADGFEIATQRGSTVRAAYGAPVEVGGVRFMLAAPPAVGEAMLVVRPHERVSVQMQQNLGAQVRKGTDVVDVSYIASDPVLAQQVANATVAAFRDLNAHTARAASRKRRIFIEEQLAQTDSLLVTAQLGLSQFRRREAVYSSRDKFAAQQVGLMGLEVRREELDSERRLAQSLLTGLEREGAPDHAGVRALVSAPGIATNTVVTQLYTQLVRYELTRDSLTAGVWGKTTTNPEVQRYEALIRSTRGELLQAVRGHISALEARVAALDDLKARNAAELRALPDVEAEEARIVQHVETIRRLADQLRDEYQKARIAEAVETGQVDVVEWATLPTIPIGSKRTLKLALGLVLGLMLGSGAAFLLENLNSAIRRREELESVLGLTGLAIIPQFEGGHGRIKLPALGGLRNGRSGAGGAGRPLVTISHPTAPASEAYRTLRTNLIFSQAVQSLKTLVVTSSSPSEGKTTTSSNLAVAFAQQGVRVLLVDCDLRRPRVDQVFGIEREPGLSAVVIGKVQAARVIQETEVEGLHVLPAGVLPPNPAELLGGSAMREVLAQLGAQYDLVILDAPPVLVAGDASILAAAADGVLLVVKAGGTDRGAARAALQQLAGVGARMVGAILNDPDGKIPRYAGSSGFYGYYGEYAEYAARS